MRAVAHSKRAIAIAIDTLLSGLLVEHDTVLSRDPFPLFVESYWLTRTKKAGRERAQGTCG